MYIYTCCKITYSFSKEKLNIDVSSSSWSSMRSLACVWSPFSSLLNLPMMLNAVSLLQSCRRHWLLLNWCFRLAKISPNLDKSWKIMSPFACIRGPIRCFPRATRFLRLAHLIVCTCIRKRIIHHTRTCVRIGKNTVPLWCIVELLSENNRKRVLKLVQHKHCSVQCTKLGVHFQLLCVHLHIEIMLNK